MIIKEERLVYGVQSCNEVKRMRNQRNYLDLEIRNSCVTLRELFDTTALRYVIEIQGLIK